MKYIASLLTIVWWTFQPVVVAQINNKILIAEVLMDNQDSASAEFVELRNPNSKSVAVDGWQLEYLSSSGTDWLAKASLEGNIQAFDSLLIATDQLGIESDIQMSSGLARTGGHIRVLDELGIEIDKLGWGAAENPETTAAMDSLKGQSLKRSVDEDGQFVDSDNNLSDFFVSDSPSPSMSSIQQEACEVPKEDEEILDPVPDPPSHPVSNANLVLTELLIDPVAPATDKEDEFVEIYNPNGFPVQIEGYVIETGSDFNYSYVLPSYNLAANEYLAIFSIDSGLTLSNSGGAARLLAPNLSVIDETEPYEKAQAGKSWSLIGNGWFWTESSPHGENIGPMTEDQADVLTKREVQSFISTGSSGQTTDTVARSVYEDPETLNTLNTKVLVSVGLVAIGYALYEYRTEISRGIEKFRRNFETWRQTWRKS